MFNRKLKEEIKELKVMLESRRELFKESIDRYNILERCLEESEHKYKCLKGKYDAEIKNSLSEIKRLKSLIPSEHVEFEINYPIEYPLDDGGELKVIARFDGFEQKFFDDYVKLVNPSEHGILGFEDVLYLSIPRQMQG